MPQHKARDELAAGLDRILAAPRDEGRLEMIVSRPAHGQRRVLESAEITLAGGVPGDHWNRGCHISTEDGRPHPDVQICMMSARCLDLLAGSRDRWSLSGDNLIVDMVLGPDNLPPGTRLGIGGAVIEVTAEPHNGCAQFIERYGRDACVFVNTGPGKTHRLRGIYARVVQDGTIHAGDAVKKLPATVDAA